MKILGIQNNINIPPTAAQMLEFKNQFDDDAFAICAEDREFCNLMTEDLRKASAKAVLILSKIKPEKK